MRKFKCSPFGDVVDLDNPDTYKYLPNTIKELRNLMFREIGYALVYMDYFPNHKGHFPKRKQKEKWVMLSKCIVLKKGRKDRKIEINNGGYNQRQRIYALIKKFADDKGYYSTNIMWWKEQVFLFQDETENMC